MVSAEARSRAQAGLPVRRAAAGILKDVLHDGRALDDRFAETGGPLFALVAKDRAFTRAIVTMALRRKGQIDDILTRFIEKPLPAKSGANEILLAASAQILFLDVAAHAAVDLAVLTARHDRQARHFHKLINAVLRRVASEGPALVAGHDEAALNTPGWLMARWQGAYGAETARAIALRHLDIPPLDLTCKADPESWATRLGGVVVPTGSVRLKDAGPVTALDGFTDGAWWVQDAAAALPAQMLGEVAGARVLDLCAAPGGKTMQLAAMGAEVTALDRSARRLMRLKKNLKRLSLKAHVAEGAAESYAAAPFDAVLLDAPCSSTGTIRRHPDIPWVRSAGDIAAMAAIQKTLLAHAAALVRPGGVLVYCTCSLEPEEGEDVVAAVLDAGAPLTPSPVRPGEIAGADGFLDDAGRLRTLPCRWRDFGPGMGGIDGFFAARLIRR